MDDREILEVAGAGFAATLRQVADDQWTEATGNDGQNVRQLVDHVVGGNRMATVILGGGTRRDGIDAFALSAADVDVVAAFDESHRELVAAFAEPRALERTVAHPALDMPGSQLLGFRITEYGLHGWDLARAIGTDDTIDPAVLDALWDLLLPMAPVLAATGLFGSGPSGTIATDAPLQERVLDLSGRRP